MKINPRPAIKAVLLIAAALALFLLPGARLPYLDNATDAYFADAMTKAGVAYGVCRAVNASVSVIKESQLQLEPAGLGVSLAAGQVLDPLDDMTERASDVLVTAIVSLGIQKIVYELCVAFAPAVLGIAILAFLTVSFLKSARARTFQEVAVKSIVLLAAARLCLPASAILSHQLNRHYFTPQITQAQDALSMSSPEMARLKDLQMPEADGVLGTVEKGFAMVTEKTSDLVAVLQGMIRNMGSMIANLLKLSYLYVALFMIQVILLPLGAFWLLARMAHALCGANLPTVLKHKELMHPRGGGNQTGET